MVEISKEIMADAVRILNFLENPAYFCDKRTHLLMGNELMLKMFGLNEKMASHILGKNWIDVLLDQNFGVRSIIPPAEWEKLALQQLVKIRQLYPKESILEFEREMSKYQEFDYLWQKSKELVSANPIFERGVMKFDLAGSTKTFILLAYHYPTQDYLIVEYLPADKGTTDFLDLMRKEREPTEISDHFVTEMIRNYSLIRKLRESPIILMNCVKKEADCSGNDLINALRTIVDKVIGGFEPNTNFSIRSSVRLKYEILRMMAYEGATDEQIMWDLGFEPDSDFWAKRNGDIARKPRFPYTGKGDYAATSRASFKRLKAQAIEDVRWRIEEMEKRTN